MKMSKFQFWNSNFVPPHHLCVGRLSEVEVYTRCCSRYYGGDCGLADGRIGDSGDRRCRIRDMCHRFWEKRHILSQTILSHSLPHVCCRQYFNEVFRHFFYQNEVRSLSTLATYSPTKLILSRLDLFDSGWWG